MRTLGHHLSFPHTYPNVPLRTFAVNTLAHFWTLKAFLPQMIKERTGHIVSDLTRLLGNAKYSSRWLDEHLVSCWHGRNGTPECVWTIAV